MVSDGRNGAAADDAAMLLEIGRAVSAAHRAMHEVGKALLAFSAAHPETPLPALLRAHGIDADALLSFLIAGTPLDAPYDYAALRDHFRALDT